MIKNILIKADLVGNGIVNMDSGEQSHILRGTDSHLRPHDKFNNTSYAKKNFYKDENNKLTYKLKISSDCLKHDLYKNEVIAQSPKIDTQDMILYSYIASPMAITRGYMFTGRNPFKRTGALSICDAEQTCGAVSNIELFSKSGEKTSNNGDSDKSDNTLYKKETVGDIKYSTSGNIDICQLQFISADQVFDRYAFNPDNFSMYKSFLDMRMENFNSVLGHYHLSNSIIDIPEYGIKLSNENILFLVKETLKKLLSLNIKRKGAFAKVSSLKIKLVENPVKDLMSIDEKWIELKSFEDIDNLNFEIQDFYELIDFEEAKAKRLSIEESFKAEKVKEKSEAAAKKSEAAAKKLEAAAKKEKKDE